MDGLIPMQQSQPITVATMLWDRNGNSLHTSNYDETWVEKLYASARDKFARPMRFLVFVDRIREFSTPLIEQRLLASPPPIGYSACLEPFALNEPCIIVGLDTIFTGPCDELADFCFYSDRPAVPRDPFYPDKLCNGVALVPAGQAWVWNDRDTSLTDMNWIRSQAERFAVIDDVLPGQVKSFKGYVRKHGLDGVRVCYFHGELKPNELSHVGWISRMWGT